MSIILFRVSVSLNRFHRFERTDKDPSQRVTSRDGPRAVTFPDLSTEETGQKKRDYNSLPGFVGHERWSRVRVL